MISRVRDCQYEECKGYRNHLEAPPNIDIVLNHHAQINCQPNKLGVCSFMNQKLCSNLERQLNSRADGSRAPCRMQSRYRFD